jgi:type IV fimbrial biogenesis protein FimT
MKSCRGVTLIELMIALAVMAILAAMAVPSFQNQIRSSRLSTAANDLSSALALARAESIRRGARVTVCRSSTASNALPTCDTGGGAWTDGWVVFVNTDADTPPAIDAGEEILRRGGPMNTATLVTQTTADVANAITYRPDGSARLDNNQYANGVLRVCAAGGAADNARDLRLRPGGRVVVNRVTSAGCAAAPSV